MKRKLIAMLFCLPAAALAGTAESAVLGSRYIGANIGQVRPGDDFLRRIDDSAAHYEAVFRTPVNENTDFILSAGRRRLDGELEGRIRNIKGTETSIDGRLAYHFLPGERFNYFAEGGIGWAEAELEFEGDKVKDDAFGIIAGGGIEYIIGELYPEPVMSVIAGLRYHSISEDDIIAGIDFNVWLNSRFLLTAGAEHAFDSGANKLSAGFAVGF